MMEIVKGRAISRTGTGYQDVYSIVEGMVGISKHLSMEESEKLKSNIKYIAASIKGNISTASFSSLNAIVDFNNIMNDPGIVAKMRLAKIIILLT